MLARHGPEREQPRFVVLQRAGIECEGIGRLAQRSLGRFRLGQRAIDGGERFGERGMRLGDAFERAGGLAQGRHRAIGTIEALLDLGQVARDLFGALHRAAAFVQRLLLAGLGRERGQFADRMFEPLAVALRPSIPSSAVASAASASRQSR